MVRQVVFYEITDMPFSNEVITIDELDKVRTGVLVVFYADCIKVFEFQKEFKDNIVGCVLGERKPYFTNWRKFTLIATDYGVLSAFYFSDVEKCEPLYSL